MNDTNYVDAERAERMLARIERMKLLEVHPGENEYEGALFVDAGPLMAEDDLSPRYWVLEPEPDGQWSHGPSGVTAHLGAALWGIACSYELPASYVAPGEPPDVGASAEPNK